MINRYLTDLASLFFPETCAGCDTPLVYGEKLICTSCWYHLPFTFAHDQMATSGTGQTASFLHFVGSSRVQRIIHQLKYRNRPEIGTLLGEKYGAVLLETTPFAEAEVIVPVPLHPKKLRKRGYNQSAYFAQGLSRSMQKPTAECLTRHRATQSQTTKTRYERYKNMEAAFRLNDAAVIAGKHVLLVDDVLTTGATLEACAEALLAGGALNVNCVTIAKAL
ncbi:ComF family protein [Parapedobacter indicus]|uniref:ComF family protein n=1 Tax=Parapedobacter indicus TaxID=1477437 RepID=A0A1I3T3V7_9SPHI|nr:ComF family protein [Parapedobacter indicus]PPK99635.1 ComF family protein [Parapedobacter indicus]SFJ65838.1 comF family protein [Parapedobacter indicus]